MNFTILRVQVRQILKNMIVNLHPPFRLGKALMRSIPNYIKDTRKVRVKTLVGGRSGILENFNTSRTGAPNLEDIYCLSVNRTLDAVLSELKLVLRCDYHRYPCGFLGARN